MSSRPDSFRQPATGRLFALRAGSHGFTLLEVMVVVVIIGIMLGVAAFSLRGDSHADLIREEATRLGALIELASDEAVMRGEELALQFSDDGYRFLRLAGGRWVSLEQDRILRPREFADGIELRLELEENPPPVLTGEDSEQPQVFLLSSGEMTPFVVTLFSPGSDYRAYLRADLLGRLELEK